jgi:hypothetical protein
VRDAKYQERINELQDRIRTTLKKLKIVSFIFGENRQSKLLRMFYLFFFRKIEH